MANIIYGNTEDGGSVVNTEYNATYTILRADEQNRPTALHIEPSRLIGRKATGGIVSLNATDARTILNVSATADVVLKSLYDANTILAATTDNTPVALTIGTQTLVGRRTGGNIDDLSTTQVRTLLAIADSMPLDSQLLAYWSFDNFDGINLIDDSGNGNSGVATGTMTTEIAVSGSGLINTSQHIDMTLSTALQTALKSGNIFMSFWLNQKTESDYANLIDFDMIYNAVSYQIRFEHANDTVTNCGYWWGGDVDGDAANENITATSLTYNAWNHFVVTLNRTDSELRIYVNGVNTDSFSTTIPTWTSVSDFNIFNSVTADIIDEIRIYSGIPTESQARALFLIPSGSKKHITTATTSVSGIAELATNTETLTGTDTGRVLTPNNLSYITQYSYNYVNVEKGRMINDIYGILSSPTNMKLFVICDETGDVSTLTDQSTIGGTTAHTINLVDTSNVSVYASAMTPTVYGVAPALEISAGGLWVCNDSADLTFALSSFSVIYLGSISNITSSRDMLAKYDVTTGSELREWILSATITTGYPYFRIYDETANAYIGRQYNTSIPLGTIFSFIGTYNGGTVNSGIKLYLNGTQVDNADSSSGTFVSMQNTTAKVGPFNIGTTGVISNIPAGYYILGAIIAEVLTATQIKRIDAILRSYSGIKI